MKTLIKNARILFNSKEKIFTGYLIIEDNYIKKIEKGDFVGADNFDKVIDAKENLIMPGFIDCHTHSPMTILKGLGEGAELEEWLFDNILPVENQLTKKDVYYATKLSVLEYLKNGITTVNDMYIYHTEEIIRAFNECGFRAVIDIDRQSQEEDENLIKECLKTNGIVIPALSCHSVYLSPEENFARKIKLSKKYNLNVSTHASETLTEVGNCVKEHGLTPIGLLESYGFFDRPCTIYHGVHLDKEDYDILKKYNVSVCTNPASNLKLASGICPLSALLEKGINVCLGTDGSASNNKLDMFREMYLVSCLQKANMGKSSVLNAEQTLQLAIENGAKALGLDKIGELKVGNYADLIMINLHSINNETAVDIKSNLVYANGAEDVLMTMINGKILYENGEFNIGISPEKIFEGCKKTIKRLQLSND